MNKNQRFLDYFLSCPKYRRLKTMCYWEANSHGQDKDQFVMHWGSWTSKINLKTSKGS